MEFKDKIVLAIIFLFIIFVFVLNKDFITFAIGVDLNKCYNNKRCNAYLKNNFNSDLYSPISSPETM